MTKVFNAYNSEDHKIHIFFENQQIDAICTSFCGAVQENEIVYGWADIIPYVPTEKGGYYIHDLNTTPIQARIEGFLHWNLSNQELDENDYEALRQLKRETS